MEGESFEDLKGKRMKTKNEKTNNSLNDAFAKDIPAKHMSFVKEGFKTVLDAIAKKLQRRFRLDLGMAEGYASAAAIYVLGGCQTGKVEWPATVEDWTNLATWKAENLVRDLVDRRRRRKELSYDEVTIDSEGVASVESPLMEEASMEAWHRHREEKERLLRIESIRYATLKVADRMTVKGGNFFRNRNIVRSVYLDDLPMPEVCQRYGVNANNAYQVLFRFRDMFADFGKKYMEEYYEWFGDEYLQVA